MNAVWFSAHRDADFDDRAVLLGRREEEGWEYTAGEWGGCGLRLREPRRCGRAGRTNSLVWDGNRRDETRGN